MILFRFMMIEELYVNMFRQITAGFSANANNFSSPENYIMYFKRQVSGLHFTPKGKFSFLLFIFIVKSRTF